MANSYPTSILQYFYEPGGAKGHTCGYCSGKDCNISNGMWLHELSCADYQELLNRGWRRCGEYSYKPIMNKTCCPLYTINCEALKFTLSKSQQKVLVKLCKYLETGSVKDPPTALPPLPGDGHKKSSSKKMSAKTKACAQQTHNATTTTNATLDESGTLAETQMCDSCTSADREESTKVDNQPCVDSEKSTKDDSQPCADMEVSTKVDSQPCVDGEESTKDDSQPSAEGEDCTRVDSQQCVDGEESTKVDSQPCADGEGSTKVDSQPCADREGSTKVAIKEGEAAIPKPVPARRAKKKKLQSVDVTTVLRKSQVKKTVEDFLSLETPMSGQAHRLEVKLVQSAPQTKEFKESFEESYALYRKYQMAVHKDKEEDCTKEQFSRFLVHSSLSRTPSGGAGPEFGSYHQQYYLDGKLVMVGVVDILPLCLSSVYVYYDPAIMFLTPGVVSALYEIAYTRMLYTVIPSLEMYCMGYYVHDCQKMQYKGQYSPSFLLCPETYRWQPIEKCRPKLDRNKYARLEDEEGHALEPVEDYIQEVLFWNGGREKPISYSSLKAMLGRRPLPSNIEASVREYATLVGKCVSTRAAVICK